MGILGFGTESDLEITIFVEGSESGSYTATASGLHRPVHGATVFDAVSGALTRVGRLIDQRTNIVIRKGTVLTGANLLEVLRASCWPNSEQVWQGGRWPTGWLDISGCFTHFVDLRPSTLDEMHVPDYLRSQWTGGLDLSGIVCQGTMLALSQLSAANLSRADLRDCVLWGAELTDASFSGSQLARANLAGAHLQGVDLRDAASIDNVYWSSAQLDKTWLYRRQIEPIAEEREAQVGNGSYVKASETFLILKSNFEALGNYEDASWAYFKEQQMEKGSFFPTTIGRNWTSEQLGTQDPPAHFWSVSPAALAYRTRAGWLHLRLFTGNAKPRNGPGIAGLPDESLLKSMLGDLLEIKRWRWIRSWIFELLTGYGERPFMPIFWGLVTIFAFFFVYWGAGNVATGDPSLGVEPSRNPLDAFTHSVAAFATIGFNTLEPVGWGARLMTAVESMMGIGFFALFIYTLGNRMSRS